MWIDLTHQREQLQHRKHNCENTPVFRHWRSVKDTLVQLDAYQQRGQSSRKLLVLVYWNDNVRRWLVRLMKAMLLPMHRTLGGWDTVTRLSGFLRNAE